MNLILLPGLWRSQQYWHEFPNHLRRRLPQIRIHHPDLPGFGKLNLEQSPTTVEALVTELRQSRWFRPLDKPVILLGQSLGAMSALHWQCRYPDEIAGCILINISDQALSWPFKRFKWSTLGPMFWHWGLPSSALERELIRLHFTSNLIQGRASIVHQRTAWHLEQPPQLMNIWRQMMALARFSADGLIGLCPILYIQSLSDKWISPDCTLSLSQKIPGQMLQHPTAGHDLALDEPAWLAERTSDWVKRLQP